MKKRIIISLLLGIIICCTAVYSFGTTGIVNTDTLRLRKSNTTESSILKLLSVDDEIEIITRTDNGWYKVKYTDLEENKTYEGYVDQKYVTVKEDETIPSEENKTLDEENNENNEDVNEEKPQEEVGTEDKLEENAKKVINKGEKIYTIPLINSNTLIILEENEEVTVLTEINGWVYVSSEKIEGWVRKEKLKDVNEKQKVGYITSNSVNFRKQPNSDGETISKLTKNKEVVILEETNGWKKVEVNNQVGYVSAEYVSDKKVTTTSRSSSYRKASTKTKQVTTNNSKETKTTNVGTNPKASEIVEFAKKFVGSKYVYGGSTPSGFDCSGFTQYVYKNFGYSLSRTSSGQASDGTGVSKSSLQPGDIICFSGSSKSKKVTHVGIYIGNGKFVHAANSRKGVIISNVDGAGFYYVCSRRIK